MALSVEGKMAILNLCTRYNYALDHRDLEACVGVFAGDAIYELGQRRRCEGIDEIRVFLETLSRTETGTTYRNFTDNHQFDMAGDVVTHSSYAMYLAIKESGTTIGMAMFYDKVKKVDGEWRFIHRKVAFEG